MMPKKSKQPKPKRLTKAFLRSIERARAFLFKHLSQKSNLEALCKAYPDKKPEIEKFMKEYRRNRLTGEKTDE